MNLLKLSAIEAIGFKSFADKIELNFTNGITAIVGPNGSGKSNVSDAIRWVLGEQSVRNLRGSSMEDIIFSGSGKRRALNIAEVSLFFSNQNGALPVDFQEVSVCRRLFRSGDSAYFINKTPCKLKDIHELFADTGLGKGSMSIIGQNKVDEILNGRPEERRAIFEEAAGITKYKQRKKDAMRRLEETDNNITRLDDIKVEIVDRLEPLRLSAEKTQRYNILASRLKECKITVSLRKIDKAEQMAKEAKAQIEKLKEEDTNATTNLNISENKLLLLTENIEQVSKKLLDTQQQITQENTKIEKLTGQKAVLAERISQNTERSEAIEKEQERVDKQLSTLQKRSDDFNQRIAEQKNAEKTAKESEDKWNKDYQTIKERIDSIEQEQEQEKTNVLERKRAILQANNDIKATETQIASSKRRLEKLQLEKEQTQDKLTSLQNEISSYKEAIEKYDSDKVDFLKQIAEIENKTKKDKESLQNLLLQERKLAEDSVSVNARINILTKLQTEYDGFSNSVKKLMTSKEPWRRGLLGAVGQLLTVPENLVVAIETALAGSVQHIVAKDDIVAKQAIEYLKREKVGRATFLPLNNLRIYKLNNDDSRFINEQGILGIASSLISFNQEVKPAVEFLLGRTLIANDLESAIKVNRKGNTRFRIVTLDGDVINAGGTMSGGSRSNKEAGFLSRVQEITNGKKKLIELKSQIDLLAQKKVSVNQEIDNNEQKKEAFAEQVAQIGVALATEQTRCTELEKSAKQLIVGLDTIDFEYKEVALEQKDLTDKLACFHKDKEQAEKEDTEKLNFSNDLLKELQLIKKEHEQANQNYHQAKAQYETAQKATELIEEQFTNLQLEIKQLVENKQRIESDYESFQKNIEKAQIEQAELSESISKTQQEVTEYKQQLDAITAQQLKLLPEQKSLEKAVREFRSNLNAIQNRLRNAETIFVRNETELSIAHEQLQISYELSVEEAREFYQENVSDSGLDKEIARLDNSILELGPINAAAIEEYSDLKNRYDFMLNQYEDLVKAKEDLKALISEIDRTMTKRFKEAFNAINGFFEDCFTRLFGGGAAKLKLLDPSNILTTGIDIVVQPPGKKLQTLTLLSGGERALTVIALLFAMLSYRPTPFCVLDEIDAALDEVNVERFNNFLSNFATDTQFIVITHRKYTMQCAHLIHGITMEESGVSRLVSIKMVDKDLQ